MILSSKIKASQVTNLTDGRYFSAWGVDWLGFSLDSASEYYIEPTKMKAIRDWLEGPKIVGEFGMQSIETIQQAIELLKLDAIQLSFLSDIDVARGINNVPIIKEIVIDNFSKNDSIVTVLEHFSEYVDSFLIDFSKNGISWKEVKAGTFFDFDLLKNVCSKYSVILGIDLATENVHEVQEMLNPYALNIVGGEEEKVGYKSFDEIDEIFEVLEVV